MNTNQTKKQSICIKLLTEWREFDCPICNRHFDYGVGPVGMLEGTDGCVCDDCTITSTPELAYAIERASSQRSPTKKEILAQYARLNPREWFIHTWCVDDRTIESQFWEESYSYNDGYWTSARCDFHLGIRGSVCVMIDPDLHSCEAVKILNKILECVQRDCARKTTQKNTPSPVPTT
ncbi:MAG: hypothetical protein DME19_18920 [Verrucomicrobia bacterium]|nr:MAG: hypothetical protein DME19_18920 [Verrucomicrobiota bacterium]